LGEGLKKKWKNKAMHGQYVRNMDRQIISEEDTFLWLSKGDLKAETESEIVAQILKYKDLTIEIQRKWIVKTTVITIIIGATGTISKKIKKYVSNTPENHEVRELQKTAIVGTAHILRKVLT
jgi:hypothetical protein